MALIERDKLNQLIPASEAKAVSETALDAINLAQVAYAINTAANTGETQTVVMTQMTDNTKEQLNAKGYKVNYKLTGAQPTLVVSWGDN